VTSSCADIFCPHVVSAMSSDKRWKGVSMSSGASDPWKATHVWLLLQYNICCCCCCCYYYYYYYRHSNYNRGGKYAGSHRTKSLSGSWNLTGLTGRKWGGTCASPAALVLLYVVAFLGYKENYYDFNGFFFSSCFFMRQRLLWFSRFSYLHDLITNFSLIGRPGYGHE